MPTVLRHGPYRFFFYSNEHGEPPHIHVQRDRLLAKFWLKPVALASSSHFPSHELRTIMDIVRTNQETFLVSKVKRNTPWRSDLALRP
ncbi:MAG TPA: DUF4160 domain-containing protein [Guyparkeria sp.]|nr:DUF4160 domain-containing protein [Guyparkeria sp.]